MEAKLQEITHFIHHKYFWLFATLSSLATLHFYYIWKISGKFPTLIDLLCWGSIFFLLWEKRNRIKFRGSFVSSAIGISLIFLMTARHILSQYYSKSSITDVLSSVFPFITVTGILLIIAGFRNLIHYKSEIIVSLTTTISSAIVISTDIYSSKQNIVAYIDAQVTAFMLHYIGFKVAREGTIISLPSGSIEVYGACSSIVPLSSILPIVVIFLFVHPANKTKKIYVCIGVIVSVIFVNAIRLSWLAIIVKQDEMFKYWHHGDGVGIFSNLIVFLIGGLSYKILEYSAKTDQN